MNRVRPMTHAEVACFLFRSGFFNYVKNANIPPTKTCCYYVKCFLRLGIPVGAEVGVLVVKIDIMVECLRRFLLLP